jgi:hypothetical protein
MAWASRHSQGHFTSGTGTDATRSTTSNPPSASISTAVFRV